MKRKKYIDGLAIKDFVNYYLGTKHNCSNLKHQGLKSFDNPYVIGVSNDFIFKYPDCIIKKELIVVEDDYGNLGTYINPNNIKGLTELEICKEKIKLLSNICCHDFEEASFLYKIWMTLINEINWLQGLYGCTYELLYIMNKAKVLKSIRKYAKEEAKRTLVFTVIKNNITNEENITYDGNELLNYEDNDNNLMINDYSLLDDYQVNEKVNRQKKLKFNGR